MRGETGGSSRDRRGERQVGIQETGEGETGGGRDRWGEKQVRGERQVGEETGGGRQVSARRAEGRRGMMAHDARW